MDEKGDIPGELRKLKPQLIAEFKIKEIALFGSFARGDQSESSDVDILADFEEEADLFDLVGLANFLEDKLQKKVDVVTRNALRDELRDEIFGDLVAL